MQEAEGGKKFGLLEILKEDACDCWAVNKGMEGDCIK